MVTLTERTPKDTFKDLLQVSNSNSGIDGTLRTVSDGEGTASPLQLSTAAVNINAAGALNIQGVAVTATAGEINKHALEFVTSIALTAVSTVDITGLASGYDYDFQVEGFAPTTDIRRLDMRFSTDGGTSYASSSSYAWRMIRAGAAAEGDTVDDSIQLFGSASTGGNDTNNTNALKLEMWNPAGAAERSAVTWRGFFLDTAATPLLQPITGGGGVYIGGNDTIDAVRFFWNGASGSTFKAQGDVTVYRRRRS